MLDKKRWTALLTAMLVLFSAAGVVWANHLNDQLDSVNRQMREQQTKAARAQQKVDSVSGRLKKIQDDLDTAVADYQAIQSRLAYTEQQIELNGQILAKAEENLNERTQILNKRMRDIYENGQLSYLDVLLGSNDFNDFTTRMELLKRVVNQDVVLVARVKAERELVLQKRAELTRDYALVAALHKEAEEKQRMIEARKNQQEDVLAAAMNERDVAENAYQELMETSRQIEDMLRRSQIGSGGAPGSTGSLLWPAAGPITSQFGWRTHPIFGTQRYHSGIDIGADYGDNVSAADGGVVIYADWMGGYGKAVIIDHGGGISTLYAHNSELLVGVGEQVRKGQSIARVGSTGYSTGPHLHFEVRENGAPVSPLGYLP
ncbi:peptidoglycan DD-metalloendopeptidase family protein|uniref:Septal ring factor EnvC, activator of murein hydrolases AmiA and AmiB n=1 Tax=Dendrosporobacter quercicolus TaxID=146817 RepID=A0A1G9WZE5_9FIRM|nr:M23 family metallopeptidase [Dendrosporobacter quercicolus]NSL49262.1 peptidoglycan DD-metalloendopeptidase family protein [Dendrosporobacter quercicolus DSM 1736]SDM89902.1 Septal ring factor EnvC, activator of murein hydrolases AmiA and AmiB [Dendrosporobacter quercicolus]